MNRIEKTFMPIWQPFTLIPAETMIGALSDEEERTVALAAHHYFQAKYADAAEESQRFLNSPCPEIRASALLLHSMANVGLGNARLVRADIAALTQTAQCPEDEKMAAIYDALRYFLAVFFHTDGEIEPIGEEHTALLPEGTRLYLLYAVAHALYLQKRYQEALGVARSALMMAAGRFPSVCVYLNLVGSMVATNLHDAGLAADFFHRAWQIAQKEDYIQPFVEHHGLLQGQIEKYIRDREPEQYSRIAEKVMAFSRGWMKIHNPDSVNKVTDRLSPYEFSLAMMAARGKSNQEIADYMHISVNTVKFHLSNIYQKVEVSNRKELEQYLNR
ncbi:MAG: helix-turn-helix transcriptional regulator [Faecousia sp.]